MNAAFDTGAYTSFRFDTLDGGAILRIAITSPRSALNAVDETLHAELAALFAALRQLDDPALRAIILTGNGVAFSAGGDFGWLAELRGTGRLAALRRDARAMIWDLLDIEVPVIAAVDGPAVGLGASIALLCDMVVAAESARFSDPHVRVGLVAGDGGAVIWPLAVGPAVAKRYLLTGDPLTAAEAHRIGLVSDLVDDAELAERALALARSVAGLPPLAVRLTKAAVNKGIRQQMETVFDYATALELTTFQSADHAEAMAAIRDHRTPTFGGS